MTLAKVNKPKQLLPYRNKRVAAKTRAGFKTVDRKYKKIYGRSQRGRKPISKKSKEDYKERVARRVARAKARAEAAIRMAAKQPALPLNIDFYNAVDGVYFSYWAGKLISVLQQHGKKKTAAKHFYKATIALKLSLQANPLLVLLETLDKIKPTFRLRNRIMRRGIIKEYPIVVLRPRQFILAVHWLKEEIQAGSGVFRPSLASEITTKLLEFRLNPKKNNLIKKRNEYTKRTIKAQFNIRYNFK